MRHKGERGQALVMVAAALGLFLLGAVGLAVDVGQLYAHRQMAQNAADAAAEAGILSIFNGTNTGTNAFGSGAYTCGSGNQTTPCRYARMYSFDKPSDTVSVEFPDPTLIRVTVTRVVPTTFMRMLGQNSGTVSASATAATVNTLSPVPIIVLDPRGIDAFFIHGNPTVTILGGPEKSIQVDSRNPDAIRVNGTANVVDLSRAGPAGTGGDFGNAGGPYPYPTEATGGLLLGTSGDYVAPASPMDDPLAGVPVPDQPTTIGSKAPLANGASGCPAAPPNPCQLYSPGYYASGIEVKNETAVFSPGLYYMGSGGFKNAANGDMYMCTGCAADTVNGTGMGMVVYNTGGGTFEVGANASANLLGAPIDSVWMGILLFNDREAATATHKLGGGGALTLRGTVYITNTKAWLEATPQRTQTTLLQGTPGSETVIDGQIITSRLELAGNAGITMRLSAAPTYIVRQVALIR